MPASMIRPEVGSRWKVSGSSMAMVAIGPMPGRTPISVPISAPASAKNRFAGVSATPKPVTRLLSSSIALPLGPDRDRKAEPKDEDRPGQHDQHDGCRERLEHAQAARRYRTHGDQQKDREHKPEPLDGEPEDDEAQGDEYDRPPRRCVAQRQHSLGLC